ncbi:hypothetical protein [Anaerococcus tetradius]|uniref:hypothetical protein n=1 Tax=Anaerococcus tetradius TaxID=33036 RepID=UPI0023F1A11A|nr:hypothetical protein [Anaerococcus tetradius]
MISNNVLDKDSKGEANKLENFLFWGITIDIFFLPYLSSISISISVILVILWMIIRVKNLKVYKEEALFVFMAILMLFGTLINPLYSGRAKFETSFITAIKRYIQFVLCFGVYFFYKDYFKNNNVDIERILILFIFYIAFFALLYKIFPHIYANIKIKLNPADNHTRRYLSNQVQYRFNYLWTDPNNISYMLSGIAGLLIFKDINYFKKNVLLILICFTELCTASNGGIIMLLLVLSLQIIYKCLYLIKSKININKILFMLFLLVLLILIYRYTSLYIYIYNNYIRITLERANYYSSSSGGRFEDLVNSFKYLEPFMLILGSGNEGFASEIGHIYWIGMYGGISYLIFMYIMFRIEHYNNIKNYLWMIPFFVGFTMNIAIGEYKWMAIYLFLLAYSRYGGMANE